jgi:hypothetical protein
MEPERLMHELALPGATYDVWRNGAPASSLS